jgi:hypothetical protein
MIVPAEARARRPFLTNRRIAVMVERRIELNRRYHRKKKMAKLKRKLAAAKDNKEREHILRKIHLLSPWWTEPARA